MSVVHSIGRVDTTAMAFFGDDFDDAQILHDRHCSQNFYAGRNVNKLVIRPLLSRIIRVGVDFLLLVSRSK